MAFSGNKENVYSAEFKANKSIICVTLSRKTSRRKVENVGF